jgi:hypothetical protein
MKVKVIMREDTNCDSLVGIKAVNLTVKVPALSTHCGISGPTFSCVSRDVY